MSKRTKLLHFETDVLVATQAVTQTLRGTVKFLDEADRLGAMLIYNTNPDYYQSVRTMWRQVCAARGRPCIFGSCVDRGGFFVQAEITLPDKKVLAPLRHWLHLAADVTVTVGDGVSVAVIREQEAQARHLSVATWPTTTHAKFPGKPGGKGRELWESFIHNLKERPDWRQAVLGEPPSPAPAAPPAA